MQYIMVTHWDGHWDQCTNNTTRYSRNMLKGAMNEKRIIENTTTIFIKINQENRNIEKCWAGTTYDFSKLDKYVIRFKVNVEREISCPDKYANYAPGWYVDEEEVEIDVDTTSPLKPPFFLTLQTTNDWQQFERYTFYLLKLLGIHEIYKYETQKGQADGFFKIGNLAVIYDCTLDESFEKSKYEQINNYCAQLASGTVEYDNISTSVTSCHKEVWIITRGTKRVIKKQNEIIVKEIAIDDLLQIYQKRLLYNWDTNNVENQLREI